MTTVAVPLAPRSASAASAPSAPSAPSARAPFRNPAHSLVTIQIASPCHMAFGDMPGDDKKRFCGECKKNVYNLSAMSATEAEALIQANGTNLCATFYRRADGTVLTQDCPVGVRAKLRATWAKAVARVAAVAVLGFGFFSFGCKLRGAAVGTSTSGTSGTSGTGGTGSAIGLDAPPPLSPTTPPMPMPGGIRYMPSPAGGVSFCPTPLPPPATPTPTPAPTVSVPTPQPGPAPVAESQAQ